MYRHAVQVKPLQYIWAKFPQYNAGNTVHIDDLSRNFAMNPKQVSGGRHEMPQICTLPSLSTVPRAVKHGRRDSEQQPVNLCPPDDFALFGRG